MTIADVYLRMDDKDNALDYLEKAYTHAEQFKQYEDGDKYQSIPLKNVESLPHHHWSRSVFDDMLDQFTNQNKYDVIRNATQFIDMLSKLKTNTEVN